MRIVIDIDGTIGELRKNKLDYSYIKVIKDAIKKINSFKKDGHYIILQTARHMKTCNGDQGKVLAKIGKKTLDWLEKNKIPYDEIYFGKPYADIYIDDLAHKFLNWEKINTNDFNDNKVNIVIPMAGAGIRFKNAGFNLPKPLIKIYDEPMIKWAMKSFNFLSKIKKYKLIFIILEDHDVKYKLGNKLKKIYKNKVEIIKINKITNGQAETCLKAKKYINNYNKLFIYNCDTFSESNIWETITNEDPDGILTVFKSNNPRFSYAKLDNLGYVSKTAEKKPISNLATTGLYYFKRGSDFVWSAEEMINKKETFNNEFYVAPCYNKLIASGKKIKTVLAKNNWVLGTPEELNYFLKNYKKNNGKNK